MTLFWIIVALFLIDAVVYSRFMRGATAAVPTPPGCPHQAVELEYSSQAHVSRRCRDCRRPVMVGREWAR